MIFSTPIFIFCFLPVTVILYYLLLHFNLKSLCAAYICVISLIFYSWSNPLLIFVILASIMVNYGIGYILDLKKHEKAFFIAGIIFNIGFLGYFKYVNFGIHVINKFFHASMPFYDIILPIGISFFTFQQIAWLTDIYTKKFSFKDTTLPDYCCFITFFPQLLAGPIVHHREMMPQFAAQRASHVDWENIFNGIVLFSIGLAKKVLIADNLSPITRQCFDIVPSLTFLEATTASLVFTFELYFDFSGYCDMALGCALFFNIRLPVNFNSPYKAANIQDFWRRWHITLSGWLRDYLYIPMGGNRRGQARTFHNLFMTFLLGGLWHGAAWTFVAWGAAHGIGIIIHRLWQTTGITMPRLAACILTFIFASGAWIFFRAQGMARLGKFADAFLGYNGFAIRADLFAERVLPEFPGHSVVLFLAALAVCALIIFWCPNSLQILKWPERRKLWLAIILTLSSLAFVALPESHPQFIYSQF